MKVPPTFLKYLGLFLIIASAIGWPVTALGIARSEPPVVLGLSWMALIISGLAFYASSQDGQEIDRILEDTEQIKEKLGIK